MKSTDDDNVFDEPAAAVAKKIASSDLSKLSIIKRKQNISLRSFTCCSTSVDDSM